MKAASTGSSPAPQPKGLRLALIVSLFLFALRWDLRGRLGFGDAEALYMAYAAHPQPAYLDHPGLVGFVARALGDSAIPTAATVHAFTAVVSTLFPWLGIVAARASGATLDGAVRAYFPLALLPEFAIGLFGLTPDLLLAIFWVSALALGALSLRSAPGSRRALFAALGAGAAVGLACLSKVSGVLLGGALALGWFAPEHRSHLKTLSPWCALVTALLLVTPLLEWETQHDYSMLRHRLVATQGDAGITLRNLGALVGGQILYVTPPFLYGGWRVFRWLSAERRRSPLRLYWSSLLLPFALLAALCLWSKVAEPHWVAPAYLALCLALAHAPPPSRLLARVSIGTGIGVALIGWAWAGTSLPMKLLGSSYEPRYDLSNDLYAWDSGSVLLSNAVARARSETGSNPVVVGPHYVVCAQVLVALRASVPVGCMTPFGDDFERWYPRSRWQSAPTLLFVTDSRFSVDPHRAFPGRKVAGIQRGIVMRGGQQVRTITVTRLDASEAVARASEPSGRQACALRPAVCSRSTSASGPGLGVVRSFSP